MAGIYIILYNVHVHACKVNIYMIIYARSYEMHVKESVQAIVPYVYYNTFPLSGICPVNYILFIVGYMINIV